MKSIYKEMCVLLIEWGNISYIYYIYLYLNLDQLKPSLKPKVEAEKCSIAAISKYFVRSIRDKRKLNL